MKTLNKVAMITTLALFVAGSGYVLAQGNYGMGQMNGRGHMMSMGGKVRGGMMGMHSGYGGNFDTVKSEMNLNNGQLDLIGQIEQAFISTGTFMENTMNTMHSSNSNTGFQDQHAIMSGYMATHFELIEYQNSLLDEFEATLDPGQLEQWKDLGW